MSYLIGPSLIAICAVCFVVVAVRGRRLTLKLSNQATARARFTAKGWHVREQFAYELAQQCGLQRVVTDNFVGYPVHYRHPEYSSTSVGNDLELGLHFDGSLMVCYRNTSMPRQITISLDQWATMDDKLYHQLMLGIKSAYDEHVAKTCERHGVSAPNSDRDDSVWLTSDLPA